MLSYIKYIMFIFLTINLFASVNFTDPTSTPPPAPQIPPDLSKGPDPAGGNAERPQIVTNSTGQYIYAIWERYDGSNQIIQTARSSDYGDNWVDPTTTTGTSVPNLSVDGRAAYLPQIATDSTGQHIYALWRRSNGANNITQVVISLDYGDNWVNPTTTTGDGGTPNLSDNGQNTDSPQITTNSTGQYVYAVWQRKNDGSNYIIQVAISSNYGVDWVDPTTVTGDGGTPNLSNNGRNAYYPQIATDFTGQYVYAIWRRYDGSRYITQVVISSDYGDNWVNPTSTPPVAPQTPPDLSVAGQNTDYPQIATSSTGRYVYATWQRKNDGSNYIIQVAISSNYGVDWVNPTTTTGNGGVPNLSNDGKNAGDPQITTNSTGQYVYAVWEKTNGGNYIIEVSISSNYGVDWINPTTVTGSCSTPSLSNGCQTAYYPQIVTDATGQYIYTIWQRYDGDNYIVQIAASLDYGVSWQNPTTVTGDGGTPNLSDNDEPAEIPQIAASSTGRYIYPIWKRANDGSNYIIQTVNGIDSLAGVTLQVSGSQVQIRFPFQVDIVNKLVWNNLPETLSYKIYTNAALTNLLAEIPAPTNHYEDNQIKRGERKTYYITWVDSDHHEHEATVVTIP